MLGVEAINKASTSFSSFISYVLVSAPFLPSMLYVLGFAFSMAMAKKNRK